MPSGPVVPEPVVEQSLTMWVQVASSVVRAALEGNAVIPVAEAVRWLDALEAAALGTLAAATTVAFNMVDE